LRTDYKLTSEDELTAMIKHSGIETWNELIDFVKKLQYGRHTNRTDFGLVITEKRELQFKTRTIKKSCGFE
jgi:hypothetical protein